MARVRDIDIDEVPEAVRPVYRRFAEEYGPFLNQVRVFAHRPPAVKHLMGLLLDLAGEVEQQAHQVLHRRRAVGKHPDLVEEGAVLLGEAPIDRPHRLGNLVDVDVAHACHRSSPLPFHEASARRRP